MTIDSAGGPVTGTATPGATADGALQVFTRNGRHVAGTPLTAAEAAALMTPENGFLPGAVYDASALQAGNGPGYRGTQQTRAVTQGLQAVGLAAGGTVTGAALPLPAAAARNLSVTDACGGGCDACHAGRGATAAMIAQALDGAVPGLSARAQTALLLSDLPAGTGELRPAGRERCAAADFGHAGRGRCRAAGPGGERAVGRSPASGPNCRLTARACCWCRRPGMTSPCHR